MKHRFSDDLDLFVNFDAHFGDWSNRVFDTFYKDEGGVYAWNIGSDTAERIGQYATRLRSLAAGRFIEVGTEGYTIISVV